MGNRTRLVQWQKRGREGTDMGVGIVMVKVTMRQYKRVMLTMAILL
jgi:hypothetical protein